MSFRLSKEAKVTVRLQCVRSWVDLYLMDSQQGREFDSSDAEVVRLGNSLQTGPLSPVRA